MKKNLIIFIVLILISGISHAKDRILIIESYHKEYQWDISYKKGIEDILGSKYELICFEMDTKRIPEKDHMMRAELAYKKFKEVNPVLVILGDDNALKYVGPKFVNTKTKVVYLGINNNPRYYGMAGHKNISGVLERPIMRRSIMHMTRYIKMKKALVLFDSGQTARVLKEEHFYNKSFLKTGNIRAELLCLGKFDKWKKTVKSAVKEGYGAIFVGLYHTLTDEKNRHVPDSKVIKWTSDNSPVPVFGFWDFSVGKNKTIGGYVLLGREQGRKAGELALDFLKNGKSKGPVTAERGRFLFSRYQVKKWGLDVDDDPTYQFVE